MRTFAAYTDYTQNISLFVDRWACAIEDEDSVVITGGGDHAGGDPLSCMSSESLPVFD